MLLVLRRWFCIVRIHVNLSTLFMFYFVLLTKSVVFYQNVSLNRITASVGEERAYSACFFCNRLLIILLFLFEEVSSSSGCFVYCGTH